MKTLVTIYPKPGAALSGGTPRNEPLHLLLDNISHFTIHPAPPGATHRWRTLDLAELQHNYQDPPHAP